MNYPDEILNSNKKSLFPEIEDTDSTLNFIDDEIIDNDDNVEFWKILIVDDEDDIHRISKIVLNNFKFRGKSLKIQNAYTANEAKKILKENDDIAIVLLDVVMESTDAGLKLVKEIREDLKQHLTRIVLRTGLPGYSPESEVVTKYDINDYYTKTELTSQRLITIITTGLRAYDALRTIDKDRQLLSALVGRRTKELEDANQVLLKMFSIIGHDLRGPIGTFKNLLGVVVSNSSQNLTPVLVQTLKILHNSSESVYFLLENLLHWSLCQRGELKMDFKNININKLVWENIKLFETSLENKDITLQYENKKNYTVFVDELSICLVIRNLISNAIKYTQKGGKIAVSLSEEVDHVKFSVKDTGIGIDKERVKDIFTNLTLQINRGTNNEKGTGLGLNLCNEFVTMNKGRIWVESELGQGSEFSFTVPKTSSEEL